jgi:hypothetical protein
MELIWDEAVVANLIFSWKDSGISTRLPNQLGTAYKRYFRNTKKKKKKKKGPLQPIKDGIN